MWVAKRKGWRSNRRDHVCQRCSSDRLLTVFGKTSDACVVVFGNSEHEGYVPCDVGLGGGDHLEFTVCLECGQIHGEFPLPDPSFARKEPE